MPAPKRNYTQGKAMRKPNTQECEFFGRKMTSIVCDVENNCTEIHIGHNNDDLIYFGDNLRLTGGEMRKERVTIYLENFVNQEVEVDLEDVLRFAAKHCRGIYERVLKETKT